jgi:hypothetical protein
VRLLQPTLTALQAAVHSCAPEGMGTRIDLGGATVEDANIVDLVLSVPRVTLFNGQLQIKGGGGVLILAAGVRLEALSVRCCVHIIGQGSSAAVSNCVVEGQEGQAEEYDSKALIIVSHGGSARLDGCMVLRSFRDGVRVYGEGSVLQAHACRFSDNTGAGVKVSHSAKAVLAGCELSHNNSGMVVHKEARVDCVRGCCFMGNRAAIEIYDTGSMVRVEDGSVREVDHGAYVLQGGCLELVRCAAVVPVFAGVSGRICVTLRYGSTLRTERGTLAGYVIEETGGKWHRA